MSGAPNAQDHDEKMRPAPAADESGLVWHTPDRAPFHLSGFWWYGQDARYRRLPVDPVAPLPAAVDGLANSTAGGQVRFQSNSSRVAVRVQLAGLANMNHMPATGQCGFDLYVGPPGAVRYCNTTKYDHTQTQYQLQLFSQPASEARHFTLYFPLYQGVCQVEVGLDEGAELEEPDPWGLDAPIVIYGTSITQGGCAARPGMAYTNLLSRALGAEVINLGFSGSGKGEPEVATIIAGISPCALLVLDYEANAGGTEQYRSTLPEFIRILREAQPDTPILVMSRIRSAGELLNEAARRDRDGRLAIQRDLVEELRQAGDAGIHFCDGTQLLGDDDFEECTVDGSHPTDLGFYRMARNLEPVIRQVLGM
ncbi:SGNH/GDSL hydrolase family protein [Candidatus Latescibacterota bacterium]